MESPEEEMNKNSKVADIFVLILLYYFMKLSGYCRFYAFMSSNVRRYTMSLAVDIYRFLKHHVIIVYLLFGLALGTSRAARALLDRGMRDA